MWVAFLEEMVKEYLPEDSDIWAETNKMREQVLQISGGKEWTASSVIIRQTHVFNWGIYICKLGVLYKRQIC